MTKPSIKKVKSTDFKPPGKAKRALYKKKGETVSEDLHKEPIPLAMDSKPSSKGTVWSNVQRFSDISEYAVSNNERSNTNEVILPMPDKKGRKDRAKKKQTSDTLVGDAYEEFTMQTLGQDKGGKNTSHQRKFLSFQSHLGRANSYTAKRLKINFGPPAPGKKFREPSLESTTVPSSPSISEIPPYDNIKTKSIYERLCQLSNSNVQIELPRRPDPNDRKSIWTAKQLSDLYLYCYNKNAVNLCDLVADTWIRAFHHTIKKVDKGQGSPDLIRPWTKSKRQNKDTEVPLPESYFDLQLKYDAGVTQIWHNTEKKSRFETGEGEEPLLDCVNDLYTYTRITDPVRFLWSNILVLHGSVLEDLINPWPRDVHNYNECVSGQRTEHTMHPDLVYDIMSHALRMVRQVREFKCEQTFEGAWCNQYHLHTKHSRPCYWELAKNNEGPGVDPNDYEDSESEADPMEIEEDGDILIDEDGNDFPARLSGSSSSSSTTSSEEE